MERKAQCSPFPSWRPPQEGARRRGDCLAAAFRRPVKAAAPCRSDAPPARPPGPTESARESANAREHSKAPSPPTAAPWLWRRVAPAAPERPPAPRAFRGGACQRALRPSSAGGSSLPEAEDAGPEEEADDARDEEAVLGRHFPRAAEGTTFAKTGFFGRRPAELACRRPGEHCARARSREGESAREAAHAPRDAADRGLPRASVSLLPSARL